MLKLVVCTAILASVRCAKEDLTCLKIPDNGQIKLLQNQIDTLNQKVKTLDNQSKEYLLKEQAMFQEVQALKNQNCQVLGAISKYLCIPPYVYEYQLTPGRQSW